MSESFAELFEESLKTVDMEPGSIVTGVVIDIDNEWVTVHAGLKSEGVIPRDQFLNASGRNPGYAVFGKVIDGMDVVDVIRNGKTKPGDVPVETIEIISIRPLPGPPAIKK